MNVIDTFITQFHNLEGTTVGEKRRQFYQLLHSHPQFHQDTTLLDAILPQLRVQTHFQKLCLVDLLIYFHRHQELSSEFQKGNDIVVNKVSKHRWFFEKLFHENATDFVDQYLPTLGYNLRVKVLKKLALILNEEQSNSLFDSLVNRYGIHVATNVLTACSPLKIEQVLTNYPIRLWASQLKILYNKNPKLVRLYLQERLKHDADPQFLNWNHPIIVFIAARDPEMYCQLQEEFKFQHCRIGKRSTKRIVRLKKDLVLENPELYITNLKLSCLVRTLGEDFSKVHLKMFPKELDDLFIYWTDDANSKLLPHYVRSRQFELFRSNFEKVFFDPLELCWSGFNNNHDNPIWKIIRDSQEREKWARLKVENNEDTLWMNHFDPGNCLSWVVPKLKCSPVAKQMEYIWGITECCLINKDFKTLLLVCEELSGTTRYDERVYTHFLEVLSFEKYKYVYNNLNLHWKYLKEILLKTKTYTYGTMVIKYLEFAAKNGTLDESEAITLLKRVNWTISLKFLKLEKSVLLLLIKVAPQILYYNDTIVKTDLHLILACKTFTKDHPGEVSIFDHPRLVESLKQAPNQDDDRLVKEAFEWVICQNQNVEVSDFIELLWQHFENISTKRLIFWFLKHQPQMVVLHLEKFLSTVLEKFRFHYYHWYKQKQITKLWRIVKCYSHLKMDQMVVEYCLKKLQDDHFEQKTHLVKPLSLLLPVPDFVKLVESYKPTSSTVDLTDDEAKNKFQIQRNMLKGFCLINAPREVVPIIFQFLTGDFVASCISPLNSCLYKTPENELTPVLERLCSTEAVSVKKHGFYFISVTQKESTIFEALKSCNLTQSIAMTYQHFVKSPSDLFWELLKTKLLELDNNDPFIAKVLVNTTAPKKYKSRYFEAAYDAFKHKKSKFANVLLKKLKKEVAGELSNTFFSTIKDDFLEMKRSDLIFSWYLIYSSDVNKFDAVFAGLSVCKYQQCSQNGGDKLKEFIETFARLYMDSDVTDPILVATFAEGFHKMFNPMEVLEEHIILSLIQFKNQDKSDLSRAIIDLHNRLISTYGKRIYTIFAACLEEISPKFFPDEVRRFEFYCDLLQFKKRTEDVLLVIKMLPQEKPHLREIAVKYYETLDWLKKSKNRTVQLQLSQQCPKEL